MAEWLGYKCESCPIKYLGLIFGANPKRVKTWDPVVRKVDSKLRLWKAIQLSKTGRLCLIKNVLNNLPIYYMSIFGIQKTVARKLTSLQQIYCLGGSDEDNGIFARVNWRVIALPLKLGDVGLSDILQRDHSLLFKWCWMFSMELRSL